MAEEVARFVVGNDSGMCKAALAGDDATRGCSVTSSGEDYTHLLDFMCGGARPF